MILVTPDSTSFYAKNYSGGKGHNLYLLSRLKLNVPDWVIIPWSEQKNHLDHYQITNEVNQLQDQFLAEKLSEKDYEQRIEEVYTRHPLSDLVIEHLEPFLNSQKECFFSVRSSAVGEDGALHSFAGQLSSFLYLNSKEKIYHAIQKCWASGHSARSLSYRKQNDLSNKNILVSVIVQVMIDPDKSGVIFTGDPIKKRPEHLIVNSVYGVGEGLVSGLLDADTFIVDKTNSKIVDENIVEKEKFLSYKKGVCGHVEKETPLDQVSIPSLDLDDINKLIETAKTIEQFYQFPQDIEWAIKDGVVYILQARPITGQIPSSQGEVWLWDNSNIVESYGGITRPLTFDFAHYVYHQVYVQFCEILMVPPKNIKRMEPFLKNMLGLFYGRVYYNLLNWYKLTSILPGYKFNRQFMETMMGTSESLQSSVAEKIKPPEFHKGLSVYLKKIIVGAKFFYFHLTIQSIVDRFLSYFHSHYQVFQKIDYSHMPSDQIYKQYQELEEIMLKKWHAPIINDFLCMVHFGIFKKLSEKWTHQLGDNIQNDLLAGNGNLESALPTKTLIQLASQVRKDNALYELIFKFPNDILLEVLRQSSHQSFYQQVEDYLHQYGFRCMSEMKLEQKDLHHNPSLFFVFLKNILNAPEKSIEEYEEHEQKIRVEAERKVFSSLSGMKKIIYQWSLKNTRKALANRENTRFCRTRVYGIVRAMFYGIGADFTRRDILECEDDVFYLSLRELTGALEGTNHIQNLKKVVQLRKDEYQEYEKCDDPAARFLTRGPVYWNNQHFEVHEQVDDSQLLSNQLKGIGCCPGIVEGTVKVIQGPEDDLVLNGEILVTTRTDPGWIPLYPSISALLVERGGLLSHSAIVAREMGLPTIVSIKGLNQKLKNGMKVRINGESGLIEVLEN